MGKVEARLKALGIVLPRPPKATGNFVPGVKVGEILYVAGTLGTVVTYAIFVGLGDELECFGQVF